MFRVMYSLRLKKQLIVYCLKLVTFFGLSSYLAETQLISTIKIDHDQV